MNSSTADDVARLQDWVGREEVAEDEASLPLVRRMAALLDLDPDRFRRGDALPENWHTLFFTPVAGQSQLGPDGHPRKGDFLPPVPLPRRMFAGRRLRFLAPLPIGSALRRTSTVAAITHKTGRSGEMVFVRVEHAVAADGQVVLREEHDIVYRPEAPPGAGAPPPVQEAALPEPDLREPYAPDPVTLFRYSALTFNGHRIHYDLPYTREQEGYPNLVVNGGLTALRFGELAKRLLPGNRLGRLAVRNVRPFFLGAAGELLGKQEGDGSVRLWALDGKGRPIATAEASDRPGEGA
ncbi:FAS1-like dehydratase domain-containing protein [Roseomonas elaeocarpi]|uniref:MaoC family dehydratase N-terminal domain-containing protein n=1 Tax=Roseomonas elaeocarpi TaxID=907779 RepID=A0ABV6JMB0_9PROT